MGLIKAAKDAIGGTLHDQWKEVIRCEDLGNEILMMKKTSENGVISNKSTIIVGPGQCAVIYDNGRIIDATAEEGTYTFDSSSTPSFFAGQFGDVFKEMWQRFTYGGGTAKQQCVFYFNLKEIIRNNYGTPNPVPFQDWSHAIPNQMTGALTPLRVEVKSFGNYSFKISNPAVFMNEIAGTADVYKKSDLVEQMRSEVVDVFQNLLNELGNSAHKIPVLELPSQTDEIKQMMAEKVFDEPIRRRGISIVTFVIESVTLSEESEKKIDAYELSSNAYMQQGRLVDAYADAVKDAANNAGGAANGFMGIGLMNMSTGGMMGGVTQGPWQNAGAMPQNPIPNEPVPQQQPTQPVVQQPAQPPVPQETQQADNNSKEENKVEEDKEKKTSKFCPECGAKAEEGQKFCKECGTKLD